MTKLRPGSITIDLRTGGIYGDLDHCPVEDLLQSAEALLSLLPQVNHKRLWGLGKAYDADCYLYTEATSYRAPDGLHLQADVGGGSCQRFRLTVMPCDYEPYWERTWYEKLVGSVRDGKVSPDTEGVPDRYREPQFVPTERDRPRQLKLEL